MAEQQRTEGVETDKYAFYPAGDKEKGQPWNKRKLKKVIMNDYILTYQELLEMKMIYEAQLESSEKDLEILQDKVKDTKERIKEQKRKVKEWDNEIKAAEKDIPEIGEKAEAERKADEEKNAKHEANLKGEGPGRAFTLNDSGTLEDVTGTES